MTGVVVGARFGWLTVTKQPVGRFVECRCDCGSVKTFIHFNVTKGNSTSCGCKRAELVAAKITTHGESRGRRSKEYEAWAAMRQRCTNSRHVGFPYYGGRGITVCQRWDSFEAFLDDIGRAPSPSHSLDRIDNDGHYEPGNVRWATKADQAGNRRKRGTALLSSAAVRR
jgi:hypothetical protein